MLHDWNTVLDKVKQVTVLTSNISMEMIWSNLEEVLNALASDVIQLILELKPFLWASDSIHSRWVLELDTVVTVQLG